MYVLEAELHIFCVALSYFFTLLEKELKKCCLFHHLFVCFITGLVKDAAWRAKSEWFIADDINVNV